MEVGTSVQYGFGVLGNLAVEDGGGLGIGRRDGLHRAYVNAPAAAHALGPVDAHNAVFHLGAVVGTVLGAGAAADTLFRVHFGTAFGVHLPLAGVGAAAHTQILHGTTETGFFMALEVVQGDDNIGIHNGPADFCRFHILAAHHRHVYIVGALQAVGNEDMAAGGVGGKAVQVSSFQVIQGVFPGADVHGVGIGEERLAAQILYQIHDDPGVAGTQMGHVAQFAKVNLNGHKFVLEVDLIHAGAQAQPGQFLGQCLRCTGAEIGKINFGCH